MNILITIVLALTTSVVHSVQYMHRVEVDAGKEECYYQNVEKDETITVEYQVVDTGGQYAQMDINFRMMNPRGIPEVAEFRREEGSHSYNNMEGDYKFCFDNQFSFSSFKVVNFDLMLENAEESYDDLAQVLARVLRYGEQFALKDEYEHNVEGIKEKLRKIRGEMFKAVQIQTQLTTTHARDRSIAEQNINRVDNMSLILVVLVVGASLAQAMVLKNLFQQK